jgi:hypothetical protein
MDTDERREAAIEIMEEFAERTGVSSERPPERYLWTDAFAVCNWLGLARESEDGSTCRERAERLVEQVHHTLGRHRDDDPRQGWISGLDDEVGEEHPTAGGLRIGKPLPERGVEDPLDRRGEWDRDGQYYHYLTRWMHALEQFAADAQNLRANRWARELATAAHAGFVHETSGGGARMYWKMSIDLSRPLVPSMGHHDPLDGLLSYLEIEAGGRALGEEESRVELGEQIATMREMCAGRDWATDDPLGLGGLLIDVHRAVELAARDALGDDELLDDLLDATLRGLRSYARRANLGAPARTRLGFRELGLALGLEAARRARQRLEQRPDAVGAPDELARGIDALLEFERLGAQIESFWLDAGHRQSPTWTEHRDINEVMLATRLAPSGYLDLFARGA